MDLTKTGPKQLHFKIQSQVGDEIIAKNEWDAFEYTQQYWNVSN